MKWFIVVVVFITSMAQSVIAANDVPTRDDIEDAVYERVMASLQHKMADDQREIASLREELQSQKTSLEAAHQSLLRLASREQEANQSLIAFSVARISDFGPVTVDTNIPYDVEYTNVGSGWNGPINAFLAPVSGVYYFSVSMFAENGERGVCSIVHTDSTNNMQKAHMYATSSSSVGHANHLVLELAQGDYVSVQLLGGSYRIHSTPNAIYNTFSGFLLFETSQTKSPSGE